MNVSELKSSELAILTDVAVTVMGEKLGEDERDRLLDLPMRRAESELVTLLSEAGAKDASVLVEEFRESHSQEGAVRRMLSEVLSDREAADVITVAYDRRKSMMALDAGIITGPVLLAILLLRIKRLKVSRSGIDIQFADSKGITWLFDTLRGGGDAK
jgi:hypothetical protein